MILCVSITIIGLHADTYIKSILHTDAMSIMGQNKPATDSTVEYWIGKDRMAQMNEKIHTIVDLVKKKIYIIDHAAKKYVETDYPLDFKKVAQFPEGMEQMMGMMKLAVQVAPNGQTKKIGNWNCTGYNMTMSVMGMAIKNIVWASKDVSFDWKGYSELTVNSTMQMMDAASIAEMKKIEGVQIASETSMEVMGQKINSNTKVVEISQKAAGAAVYAIPAGYTKNDKLNIQDLQQ